MTKPLEVFFDYACPYCDDGIRQFLNILPDYPNVEIIWRPCEAHPRPEHSLMHSDLAIQAMYCLRDLGGDLVTFHLQVFDAWFGQRKRIDDVNLLAHLAGECGGSEAEVMMALRENRYAAQVTDGNNYAWGECGLYAVPSYICNGRKALSRDGILVPIHKVREILEY